VDWTWFLFSFKGRINRAKCWLAGLVIFCWMIFVAFIYVGIGIPSWARRPSTSTSMTFSA
jgi:uncharacterized membrane protein YhaH (DUF805 family)